MAAAANLLEYCLVSTWKYATVRDQEEASACVEGVATSWKDMGLKVSGLNPSARLEFHPEISIILFQHSCVAMALKLALWDSEQAHCYKTSTILIQ